MPIYILQVRSYIYILKNKNITVLIIPSISYKLFDLIEKLNNLL